MAGFARLFGDAVTGVERAEPTRLLLRLWPDPGIAARAARLAAAETACCTFFTFTLRFGGGSLTLDVTVPAAYTATLDAMAATAASAAKASAASAAQASTSPRVLPYPAESTRVPSVQVAAPVGGDAALGAGNRLADRVAVRRRKFGPVGVLAGGEVPEPVLTGLERGDDRMTGLRRVLAGVL